MILQSLNAYYDRLSTTKQGVLPPYGWSWEKISYCVVLNADGSIHDIQDLRIPHEVKNKTIYTPRSLMIPMFEGRTSGVKANYLWDNSAYTLGLSEKPKDLEKKYEDFWTKVLTFDHTNSKSLKAMRNFQLFWNDNKQNYYEKTKEVVDANFVFRLLDEGNKYIHDCEEFKKQWAIVLSNYLSKLSDGQCLIEGETAKIAELHSSIKA